MSNPCLVTSSHREYIYDGEECFCQCKKLAPRRTSWTDANPGRRFYGCADFKVSLSLRMADLFYLKWV
ncbi:hypothetical protein PTKIN_Ptkin12aG0015700 [Pterospermum kingtungense]